jgi:hypothetical protein
LRERWTRLPDGPATAPPVSPYSILWFNTLAQAFRTDTWTGYSHVPKGRDGAAFRNMLRDTYIDLKPVTATTNTAESGSSTGVIVAVVVVIIVVAPVLMRRRPLNATAPS